MSDVTHVSVKQTMQYDRDVSLENRLRMLKSRSLLTFTINHLMVNFCWLSSWAIARSVDPFSSEIAFEFFIHFICDCLLTRCY